MKTVKNVYNCKFIFDDNPADQLIGKLPNKAVIANGLLFDLNICGYSEDDVYIAVNQIKFSGFTDLLNGNATVEIESNIDPDSIFTDSSGIQTSLEKLVYETNDSIILVDSEGIPDTIEITFSSIKFDFQNPIIKD